MARYPGARWRPVTRYLPGGSSNQPMERYDVGVDHTYVGSPTHDEAFARFNTPGTPIPHFMIFRDGSVVQYVDTKYRSSACLDGNPRTIAWETADGFPGLWTNGQAPKDTPRMVASKAKLLFWLNQTHGIPLVRCPSSRPTARGMGWHRLGIDGNFPQKPGELLGGRVAGGERWSTSTGKTCPTDVRIHQFVEETLPAAVQMLNPKPKPVPSHRHHTTVSLLSGRFDAADADVAADWAGERAAAGLLLGTELAHRADDVLLGGDPKFGLVHGQGQGDGENAAAYRKTVWDLKGSGLVEVLPGGGTGRFAQPTEALTLVLDHVESDDRWVFIQDHDPAHNTKASKFFRPGNMRRWLKVQRAKSKAMEKLEAAHPHAIFAVTGDMNAPQTAPWFLRAMTKFFPGFKRGGGYEYGALWVKGAKALWHRDVPAKGSDHKIRRIGLTW